MIKKIPLFFTFLLTTSCVSFQPSSDVSSHEESFEIESSGMDYDDYQCLNLESVFRELAEERKYIICSQWNVGQFGHGSSFTTIKSSNFNQLAPLWNKEVISQCANLCGLVEYNEIFGFDFEGNPVSPDDVVWNEYPYKVCFRQNYTARWHGGNAINSTFKLFNSHRENYSCFEDREAFHSFFYTVSDMMFMGVVVKVVECSVPFNQANYEDNTYQMLAYEELVQSFHEYPFVILMGDFELVDYSDYDVFLEGGFSLCNGGEFGWFQTCHEENALVSGVGALDNIIVKGFNIKNVRMSSSDLSDHRPLIAVLEIE